ncbi:MAG: DUF2953 domain-containing protein [Oscillospiraceae bacterium]|jgi:hypothetical protein|nr:DUF2953 domain-containing protein [Oscillospiraceae bacterium]
MIALGIVAAAVCALALVRLGVSAEYGEGGLELEARIGAVRLRLYPRPLKRRARAARGRREPKTRRPGGLAGFTDIAAYALKALGRLRRRLLIKRLVVRWSVPGADDPARAAMTYGGASAAAAPLERLIDGAFRVKRRELSANVDFCAAEPRVYISAAVSAAVWELVYVACALLPAIVRTTNRKGKLQNGQTSGRRSHGDDDAKTQGDSGRKHHSRAAD